MSKGGVGRWHGWREMGGTRFKVHIFLYSALTYILAQLYNVGNLQITLTYVVFMAPLAAQFMAC